MGWVWALGRSRGGGQGHVYRARLRRSRSRGRSGGAAVAEWGKLRRQSGASRAPFSRHVVSSCFVLRRLNSVRSHASARCRHGKRFRIRCTPQISRSNVPVSRAICLLAIYLANKTANIVIVPVMIFEPRREAFSWPVCPPWKSHVASRWPEWVAWFTVRFENDAFKRMKADEDVEMSSFAVSLDDFGIVEKGLGQDHAGLVNWNCDWTT